MGNTGIRTRRRTPSNPSGFTRSQKSINPMEMPDLFQLVVGIVLKLPPCQGKTVGVGGVYLNWYRDGTMFTPTHSHPNTIQVVISLGATRTLIVKGRRYFLNNGDAILFGSSSHSVPAEPQISEGRLSIACFIRL